MRTPAKENTCPATKLRTPSANRVRPTPSKDCGTPSRLARTPQTPLPDLDDKDRVRAFVRVRPSHEHEEGGAVGVSEDARTISLHRGQRADGVSDVSFTVDQVLPQAASQQDVYNVAAKELVADVLAGFNATIMAYGQTGAGKTYTLSSVQPGAIGIMPRAATDIFRQARDDAANDYIINMSYVQIYQELVQDLLHPGNDNLNLREREGQVYIEGVTEVQVDGLEECMRLLLEGDQNRTTAFTAMNAQSSRSHAIVMLKVVKRKRSEPGEPVLGQQTVQVGNLFLVDLAGSERLKKSGSEGQRADEAKAINLSLTTLAMCIEAKAKKSQHVPLRSSKLTRLLQESLGGNARTSLVVAVADAKEHVEESVQALQFGSRAMHVKTHAKVNEMPDHVALTKELLASLGERDADYYAGRATNEHVEKLTGKLQAERNRNNIMLAELQSEREAAEAEQRQLAEKLRAAEGEKQQHELEKVSLQMELSRKEEERAEKLKLLAEKEHAIASMQEDKETLCKMLAEAQAQHDIDARELTRLNEAAHVAEDMINSMKSDALTLQDEKAALSAQLTATQAALTNTELEVRQLQGAVDASTSQCSSLQQQLQDAIAASKASAEAAEQRYATLQREAADDMAEQSAAHAADLQTLKERHGEEVATAAQALATEQAKLASCEAELARARQTEAALRNTLADSTATVAQQQDHIAQLTDTIKKTEGCLLDTRQLLGDREQEIVKLQDDLRQLQGSYERHCSQAAFDLSKLQEVRNCDIEVLTRKHHSALEDMQARLQRTAHAAADAEERWSKRAAELQSDIAKRTDAVVGLERQLTESQLNSKHLTGKLMQAEERAQRLEVQCTTLQGSVTELTVVKKQLQKSLQSTEDQCRGYQLSRRKAIIDWQQHQRRRRAACRIQRAWRQHATQRRKDLAARTERALQETQAKIGNLAAEKGELEQEKGALQQRQAESLAWLGQWMVISGTKQLAGDADALLAAFLLPQKELKDQRKPMIGGPKRSTIGRAATLSRLHEVSGNMNQVPSAATSPASTPRESQLMANHGKLAVSSKFRLHATAS